MHCHWTLERAYGRIVSRTVQRPKSQCRTCAASASCDTLKSLLPGQNRQPYQVNLRMISSAWATRELAIQASNKTITISRPICRCTAMRVVRRHRPHSRAAFGYDRCRLFPSVRRCRRKAPVVPANREVVGGTLLTAASLGLPAACCLDGPSVAHWILLQLGVADDAEVKRDP